MPLLHIGVYNGARMNFFLLSVFASFGSSVLFDGFLNRRWDWLDLDIFGDSIAWLSASVTHNGRGSRTRGD